jgi:starvation-inducible DNA-binding protein
MEKQYNLNGQGAEVIEILEDTVIRTVNLYLLTKMAHWNIKGPAFRSLHELFDEVAEHLRLHADTLAERAAALGAVADINASALAEQNGMPRLDPTIRDGYDLTGELCARLGTHAAALRKSLERVGEELCDYGSEHLMAEILTVVDKDLWILESHLEGREAGEHVKAEESPELPGH